MELFLFRLTRPVLALALAAITLLSSTSASVTYAESSDPIGSIYAAAANHGVDAGYMLRVAECESHSGKDAYGDNHTSIYLYMLNGLPTGLLHHFYYVGYDDPWDAEQQADYFARVLAGEFLPNGRNPAPIHPFGIVSVARWTCKG